MAKFKFLGEAKAPIYGGNTVEPGDTFEVDSDHLAAKARANPLCEEVKRTRKKADD